MENNELYSWVFRHNPMDKKWYAAHRDNYSDLFSNLKSKNVLKSNSIATLMELINKTGGKKEKINSLLNKKQA